MVSGRRAARGRITGPAVDVGKESSTETACRIQDHCENDRDVLSELVSAADDESSAGVVTQTRKKSTDITGTQCRTTGAGC